MRRSIIGESCPFSTGPMLPLRTTVQSRLVQLLPSALGPGLTLGGESFPEGCNGGGRAGQSQG